ncbi:MAG TPA: hypothetical protein VF472_14800 [Burkholderiaceae bacterium]
MIAPAQSQQDLITQIATQIVEQTFLENWKFYALLAALFLIGICATAYLTAYWKSSAEAKHRERDFENILQQLRKSEEIKTLITATAEDQKYVNNLHRERLETLVQQTYLLTNKTHAAVQKSTCGADTDEIMFAATEELARIDAIRTLYFPDLITDTVSLYQTYTEATTAAVRLAQATRERADREQQLRTLNFNEDEFRQLSEEQKEFFDLNALTAKVEQKRKELHAPFKKFNEIANQLRKNAVKTYGAALALPRADSTESDKLEPNTKPLTEKRLIRD